MQDGVNRTTDYAYCGSYSLTMNEPLLILSMLDLWSAISVQSDVRESALWATARLKKSQREPFALLHEAIHLVFLTLLLHVPLPSF